MLQDTPEDIIVIDNGSVTSRVGFAGDQKPTFDIPTIVGRIKHRGMLLPDKKGNGPGEHFFGDECTIARRPILSLKFPIEGGLITNWDDMEKFWEFTIYKKLLINPNTHSFLFTESPYNPMGNREMMTQIMFELFSIPALNMANQAVMSLYDSGRYSGIVLDSGNTSTCSVPIYDGKAVPHAMTRSDLGGSDLTSYLLLLLSEKGYSICGSSSVLNEMREIKEKVCYVALDYENIEPSEKQYELPDRTFLSLNEERFKCTEVLFKPNLFFKNEPVVDGIHEMVYNSIEKCEEIRKDLYGNVVLSGGNTMFEGIGERLNKELTLKVSNSMDQQIQVIAPSNRNHSAWCGASLYACLSTFKEGCVTIEEYKEFGPGIIHRKCL